MDTYSFLRHFADSWGLFAMFLIFVGVTIFALRPGSKTVHEASANIPLRAGDNLEDDLAAIEKTRQSLSKKEARK